MDIFRAIFQDSDAEDHDDDHSDEQDEIAKVSAIEVEPKEKDVMELLRDVERNAKQLEKKEFPVAANVAVVVGPAKPPPELLAVYASASVNQAEETEFGGERSRRKKKHKKEQDRKDRKVSHWSENRANYGVSNFFAEA